MKFYVLAIQIILLSQVLQAQRQSEKLNRGVVAVRNNDKSAFISWRLLKDDAAHVGFNIYRSADNS
jgi:rhamnogalacturonan endolyase